MWTEDLAREDLARCFLADEWWSAAILETQNLIRSADCSGGTLAFFDMIADLLSMGRIDLQVALKFEHKTSKGCTSSGNPYEWGIYQ